MTKFEVLSVLLGAIATVLSLIAIKGQRKLQKEANRLQEFSANLADKQLKMIEEAERDKNTAKLMISLRVDGPISVRFYITNIGNLTASNINATFHPDKNGISPVSELDYADKFPIKAIAPGSCFYVMASMFSSNHECTVDLDWINPDGSQNSETFIVPYSN